LCYPCRHFVSPRTADEAVHSIEIHSHAADRPAAGNSQTVENVPFWESIDSSMCVLVAKGSRWLFGDRIAK
jgi:hypothetical protein